jgi:transcriptional regulator NrdR family protein
MTCPFCDSAEVEEVSQWGGQMITRQLRCRACNSYFEAIRDEFVRPAEPPPPRAA